MSGVWKLRTHGVTTVWKLIYTDSKGTTLIFRRPIGDSKYVTDVEHRIKCNGVKKTRPVFAPGDVGLRLPN